MDIDIIIPARRGSKGIPEKNQLLLDHTLSKIPLEYHEKTIITTDDEFLINKIGHTYSECRIHHRSEKSAQDTASVKECIAEVINDFSLNRDIIMLYLTYPNRDWQTIVDAYKWYTGNKSESLLCREPIQDHPYLCMYEIDKNKGRQIIEHDLYRRQDYPTCFRLSHMISIFNAAALKKLNKNLYNENTNFYRVPQSIDVDTYEDLRKFRDLYDS
jgi:CMP-N-acetylneuraminic acid synthetase